MAITAARAIRKTHNMGVPMPYVPELQAMYDWGWNPHRGEVIMVAGRPGSQKSGFATWLAVKWGLPTIYFSADMSRHTAGTRLGSVYTGLTSDEVSAQVDDPASSEAEKITAVLRQSPIQFSFETEPSLDYIEEEISAYVEVHDDYPALIVLDNLLDMEAMGEPGYQSNRAILLELKTIARRTGITILVLHHNKENGNPIYPAPAAELQDKVSQSVESLLSIALEPAEEEVLVFRVAVCKQREGRSDPTAKSFIELRAEPARTRFMAVAVASYYDQFRGDE